MLKGLAIINLLKLPLKDQKLIFKQIPIGAKQAKGDVAKKWARILYRSLDAGRLVQ